MNAQMNSLRALSPDDRVCYLLGAGFSAAVDDNYPTACNFLMRKIPRYTVTKGKLELDFKDYDEGEPDLKGLLCRIKEQYGCLDSLNLEHVITDLYVRAFGLGRAWERAVSLHRSHHPVFELQEDYRKLIEYIRLRLDYLAEYPDEHRLARRFVKALRRSDSVLTLNYDTVVERHLDSKDKAKRLKRLQNAIGPPGSGCLGPPAPMFRGRAPGERGVFAKLHGSIDWITCPNENCPNRHYIQAISAYYPANRDGPKFAGMNRSHCDTCGWSSEIVIVPPTAAKPFERFPRLSVMWSQAHEALRQAQRWVFIGVSFAATDFHLSTLLRAASRDARAFRGTRKHTGQICIVNKGKEAAEDVKGGLLSALSREAKKCVADDENPIVPFESLEQYLHTVEDVDANRKDDSGANGQA